MKFDVRKDGDIIVVTPQGSLEWAPDTFQIKDEIKGYLAKGETRFVLDMSQVGFVNSTGIGVAVSLLSTIVGGQGKLNMCCVSERARRTFVITGVWPLFKTFDTLEDAKKALG